MTHSIFGNKLREFREDKELTQEALAERMGYGRKWIIAWENGSRKRGPSRELVIRFADALKLDAIERNDLLEAAGYEPDPIADEIEEIALERLVLRQEAKEGAKKGALEALSQANLESQKPPAPIPTLIPEPRAKVFVGREDEIKWVKARLLAGDEAALVGVKAIGGIGKTELAIAVMQDEAVKQAFPGGIFWLECGALPTLAVQERLAEALGIALTSTELPNRAAALSLALSQRQKALLVLDDIRRHHISEFHYLRPDSPHCAALVTSRRDDLPLDDSAVKKLGVLPEEKGEQLLTRLLEAAKIAPDDKDVAAIAELLEQIPLALTLAAGRAKRIAKYNPGAPLTELLADLRQRRLRAIEMSNESKDLSVRITFDASYDELNENEQWWLAHLGLFARNSFELEAVRWVWDMGEAKAKTAMEQLVFAGLVEQTGSTQYWMHDLLREYAGECLSKFEESKQTQARLRYATFWKSKLENIELITVADWEALFFYRVEVEQAASWLLPRWEIDPNLSAELAVEISQTLQSYSITEWEIWLRKGMAAAKKSNLKNAKRRLQRTLGEYFWMRGAVIKAEEFLRSSLSTAEEILTQSIEENNNEGIDDGRRGVAVTQSSLAALLTTRGQYDEAERLYRLSLDVKEQIGDRREVAVTQVGLADLMVAKGDLAEAEAAYQRCLEIFQQLRDAYSFGAVQTRLSQLYLRQNRQEEAVQILQSARELFVRLKAPNWVNDIDQFLNQANKGSNWLDELVTLIQAAQAGDKQAGEQAWAQCDALSRKSDPNLAAIGLVLRKVLIGLPPTQAFANLPAELKEPLLAAFS